MKSNPLVSVGIVIVFILPGLTTMCSGQSTPAPTPARNDSPAPGRRGPQGPIVRSPEVREDRKIVFRLMAPQAESVALRTTDLPIPGGSQMNKGEDGVWEVTVGPVEPGAYRYTFTVNGVQVLDPQNTSTSESNATVHSLVYVPGAEFMDTNNVPHGAVASILYFSKSLDRNRRMHIYTPPGYEAGQDQYPVFYLLHGAGDSDDSWTSVGRAGIIMDNLIAAGKAKPMVVVMPAGHTSVGFGMFWPGGQFRDEFAEDFVSDIMPYVESHYRVFTDRAHRAMAGLSMGGGHTLGIGFTHLDKFGYLGVFSSGIFGNGTAGWEKQRQAILDDASLKDGLNVLWFATGSDDFLLQSTKNTIEVMKKHGFNPVFKETSGGHTWINWRNYLNEFAPMLFNSPASLKSIPAIQRVRLSRRSISEKSSLEHGDIFHTRSLRGDSENSGAFSIGISLNILEV
jgi:enterochelin esterase-like enzyme